MRMKPRQPLRKVMEAGTTYGFFEHHRVHHACSVSMDDRNFAEATAECVSLSASAVFQSYVPGSKIMLKCLNSYPV